MNLDDSVINQAIETEKLFHFEQGQCFYKNKQSYKKEQPKESENFFQISNRTCLELSSKLVKLTEIRFRNKVVCLEDTYFFHSQNPHPNKLQDLKGTACSQHGENQVKPQKKNKLIFKKKLISVDQSIHPPERRNTKNTAKNFCRGFISYLKNKHNQTVLKRVKDIVSVNKFNNRTIQTMVNDQQVKQNFKQFLITQADSWVEYSKISNKDTHKEAIQLYLELIDKSTMNIQDSGDQFYGCSSLSDQYSQNDQVQ